MREIKSGENGKSSSNQIETVSLPNDPPLSNQWAQASKACVVTVRYFKYRKAPNAPAPVAFLAASRQVRIRQRVGSKPDGDQNLRN